MLNEILEKAFAVLDLLFGKFEWWNVLKEGIVTAVMAVEASFELSQDEKTKKKNDAILVGLAIDALVGWLNHQFGHSWLSKIPELS